MPAPASTTTGGFAPAATTADAEANAAWFAEVATLEAALERFDPRGDVLELACGTGLWTRHLVAHADRVTAVDGAPEVLELNRARTEALGASVTYVEADLFNWQPPAACVRRLCVQLLAVARARGAVRAVLGDGVGSPATGRTGAADRLPARAPVQGA